MDIDLRKKILTSHLNHKLHQDSQESGVESRIRLKGGSPCCRIGDTILISSSFKQEIKLKAEIKRISNDGKHVDIQYENGHCELQVPKGDNTYYTVKLLNYTRIIELQRTLSHVNLSVGKLMFK